MCSSGAPISGDLKITWLKDGRELTSNPDQKIHQIHTMSILSVPSLSAANSGKYTCTASSSAGTTSVSKEMMVYGQYVFLKVIVVIVEKAVKPLCILSLHLTAMYVSPARYKVGLVFGSFNALAISD